MHKGSCSCGNIKYEYSGVIDEVSMCHCKDCQKAQGTAFVAISPIESKLFTFVKGEQFIKSFRCNNNKTRSFCCECGSPIYSARDDKPDDLRLRLGTLDTPVKANSKYHVFVSSKADWYEITDNLVQHEKFKLES